MVHVFFNHAIVVVRRHQKIRAAAILQIQQISRCACAG
jgi:hypothetical protein